MLLFQGRISTFGEDANGELYIANYLDNGHGEIHKISTLATKTTEINPDQYVQIITNPVSNELRISSYYPVVDIQIFDANGVLKYSAQSGALLSVDISDWTSGNYYVQWATDKVGGTSKFLKVN